MQAIVSMPFFLIASAFVTNPGRCLAEHVGVNAPGTENNTTFLPLNRSSVESGSGPLRSETRELALRHLVAYFDGHRVEAPGR